MRKEGTINGVHGPLSLFLHGNSTEEAGRIVAARDCLSKGKKGNHQELTPTFASVNLMILTQEEVEAEMQVNTPERPSLWERSFSWMVALTESHTLLLLLVRNEFLLG